MTKDGVFFVKSMYKALQPRSYESFPWKLVWNSCVQLKIFFSAQAKSIPLANKCHLCLEIEETVDRLLLHCVKTRSTSSFFSLLGFRR